LLGEKFDVFGEIVAASAKKVDILNDSIAVNKAGIDELWVSYENGTITLDDYVTQMKDKLPEILNGMKETLSLDKQMMEYYGNAFDAAEEEFSSYLDLIDHGISKLDHFKNMLSLIGKENNNKMMDVVL
jgi:2-hydroxy-3-keto-5-methylthiopentenyl-1-phosphate phosphatase